MAVAVDAAWVRTSAGSLLVATTTTLLAKPAGPRSRSMNSFTSRPRSPIRAITITSASVIAGHHAQQHAFCRRRSPRRSPSVAHGRRSAGRRWHERRWRAAGRCGGASKRRAAGDRATCGWPTPVAVGRRWRCLRRRSLDRAIPGQHGASAWCESTGRGFRAARRSGRSRGTTPSVVAESDHLGQQRRTRLPLDFGHGAHWRGESGGRNGRADRLRYAAGSTGRHDVVKLFDKVEHDKGSDEG